MNDLYIQVKSSIPETESGTYAIGRASGIAGILTNSFVGFNATRILEMKFDVVSVGLNYALGIKDGELYSIGLNVNGSTGQGTTIGSLTKWTKVGTDTDWLLVSAGLSHSMAIKTNGTLYSWGLNTNGRTGLGTTTGTTLVPTQVGSDTNWEYVDCGIAHTAGIKGGTLVTCGNNTDYGLGQAGLSTSDNISTFAPVNAGSTGWTYCSAGQSRTIGIKDLDIWSTSSLSVEIQQTTTSADFVKAYAGPGYSFGIKTDGTLFGIGIQNTGVLGNGATSGTLTEYTQIGTANDWEDIVLYKQQTPSNQYFYSIAKKGGKLFGTGSNIIYQLGILDSTTSISTWTQLSDIDVDSLCKNSNGTTLFTVA